MKLFGSITILLATAMFASAAVAPTPEIDSSSAVSAIALIAGGLLVARSRKN